MSDWGRRSWYPKTTKRPPPAHGVKMKSAGTTWWGKRWIESLERLSSSYSSRLARGRTYARAGRTHDLVVAAGKVTARVTGSRPQPYRVSLQMASLGDAAWTKAVAAMAGKAAFAAELLGGRMPQDIDEAFGSAGASLFAAKPSDLVTACSCPDFANPCKHVAATHYVLGEAFDRDPFLLFELRGRTREQVLAALRAVRSDEAPPKSKRTRVAASEPRMAKVSLGKVSPAAYDAPRGSLPALHLAFDAPLGHGAVLSQLGAPSSWRSESAPAEALAPMVRAGAELARRIALFVDPGGDAAAEPETPAPPTSRSARAAPRTRTRSTR